MDNEEKVTTFIPPIVTIEGDDQGNIQIRSNISNKMILKHHLEIAIELVIKDITDNSSLIYVPGPNGMPIRGRGN